jgi:hypothetical protein
MNTKSIIFTLIGLMAVIGVTTANTVYGESVNDKNLLEKITTLEKKIVDQNGVILAQIETIMSLIETDESHQFSLEKYPQTEGFSPAWLEDEKDEIIENCKQSQKVGYIANYCKHVQ